MAGSPRDGISGARGEASPSRGSSSSVAARVGGVAGVLATVESRPSSARPYEITGIYLWGKGENTFGVPALTAKIVKAAKCNR